MRYVPPGPHKQSFTCPRCGVLAQQKWYPLLYDPEDRIALISKWAHAMSTRRDYSLDALLTEVARLPLDLSPVIESNNRLYTAFCQHCGGFTLWLGDAMIYPRVGEAPPPHEDMPPRIRELYEEARGVLPASPGLPPPFSGWLWKASWRRRGIGRKGWPIVWRRLARTAS
jgi:hypothetical protein